MIYLLTVKEILILSNNIYLFAKNILIRGNYILTRNYIHFKEPYQFVQRNIFVQGNYIHSRKYIYLRNIYLYIISALGVYLIFGLLGSVLVQGGRLFETGRL